jgi:histidinol phosphatase-like enzyme (inositol monophosphatase family)
VKPETLQAAARVACRASDAARGEILPRFRTALVETKSDGSPVTEADLAAETVMREILRAAFPEFGVIGEEFGSEGPTNVQWILDPIDGTIAYSRGIPLYSTLIALVEEGEPVLGLIDLPALDERIVGWEGGGCRLNDRPISVSTRTDSSEALIAHGDAYCFELAGQREAYLAMAARYPLFRGYTDAFGHAQVLAGGVDAMVDMDLNPWDAAATQILTKEAGGRCVTRERPGNKLDLVFGSPALVEELMEILDQ